MKNKLYNFLTRLRDKHPLLAFFIDPIRYSKWMYKVVDTDL